MNPAKDLLEGKPLGSPLHPALVHLPIALFPLSLLLDIASWIWSEPALQLVRGAFLCIAAGLVTALLAAITGFVDYAEIRDDHPAKKTATMHMALNLVSVGLFGLGLGLRFDDWNATHTPGLPLAISAIAVAVLAYSGYLGGHLVYSEGIGVGRHRRDPRLPETTIVLREKAGTLAAVGKESALGEGDTLRVDANGTIVTIARADGTVHAVQEFCSHRYGPLSEGEIHNCEVTCPWHASRFDLRTGKVTHGPAKVDLRTFHVETRDGKVWLRMPEERAS